MIATSERPPINALFKRSVLAWREGYLASKTTTQQEAAEKPPEKAPAAVLKIRRARRRK